MERTMFGYFHKTAHSFPHKDFQRIKKGKSFHGVTYRQAYQTVLELGAGLIGMGVGRGDNVGLICDNRPEWILINLALQGIGAPDVPRDCAVPLPELEGIVDDCRPRFLIVENEEVLGRIRPVLRSFPSIAATFTIDGASTRGDNVYSLEDVITEGRSRLAQGNNVLLEAAAKVAPDDTSTIVYTSGTQGIPKGTILTHANFSSIPPTKTRGRWRVAF